MTIHRLRQAPEVVGATDVLEGGTVLPGCALDLRTIFRDFDEPGRCTPLFQTQRSI